MKRNFIPLLAVLAVTMLSSIGNRAYLFYTSDLPAGHHKLKLVNSAERNPRSSGNKLYVEKILAYK